MNYGLIFDMDGVIIDSEPLFLKVEQEMFEYYGIPFDHDEIFQFMGRPLAPFWEYYLSNYAIDTLSIDQAIDEHISRYLKEVEKSHDLSIMEGLKEWFETFKERDIPMVIASSSSEKVVKTIIERLSLNDYVKGYVAGDMIDDGKPAPDIFLKASEIIGREPRNCLVIEDSTNGILAAKRAGMKCIGYYGATKNQNQEKADVRIGEYTRSNLNKALDLLLK